MDLTEKAKIRIDHWIQHNESHEREYTTFAEELKSAGQSECAQHILELAKLTADGSKALRRALDALA